MTWEPRPLPTVTPETEPFWAGAADGELRLGECTECGLVFYYPRASCPDCLSDDVDWRVAEGTGEIYTFAVGQTLRGWPDEALPAIVAYVELDEGPRVLTNVLAEPEDVAIGDRVAVEFVETEEADVAIPVFVPTGD